MPETGPGLLRVRQYGDAAALIEIEDRTYEQRWRAARALGQALLRAQPRGLVDVVATYESVLLVLDPLIANAGHVQAWLPALAGDGLIETAPSARFEVPVLYGGEAGPDLVDVAEELSLRPDQLVELHASADWIIRFIGSPVAAPFLDGPALPATVRRLAQPRQRVPTGSLALSGHQSMFYSAASPGGWRLIGRTPCALFELAPPHVRYQPGDRMRFVPISEDAWHAHTGPLTVEPVR